MKNKYLFFCLFSLFFTQCKKEEPTKCYKFYLVCNGTKTEVRESCSFTYTQAKDLAAEINNATIKSSGCDIIFD